MSNKTPAQFYFEKVQFLKLVQTFSKNSLEQQDRCSNFFFEKVKIFKTRVNFLKIALSNKTAAQFYFGKPRINFTSEKLDKK